MCRAVVPHADLRRDPAPFTWFANDASVLLWSFERETRLTLEGPGFVTLAVVDAQGRAARASDGTRLLVADACNNRILVYDALPTTTFAPADVVIGQATMTETACTACSLDEPFNYVERLAVGGGRLVVAEWFGHHVLVWNSIPTANGVEPDLVLGQPGTGATCVANDDDQNGVSGDPSGRTFNRPWDTWTDGDRLLVTDYDNHRVLLWESFPTSDFTPADVPDG